MVQELKRVPANLQPGRVYHNLCGSDFYCIAAYGDNLHLLINIKSGWTLVAHGVGMYNDDEHSIDWHYSEGLGFRDPGYWGCNA